MDHSHRHRFILVLGLLMALLLAACGIADSGAAATPERTARPTITATRKPTRTAEPTLDPLRTPTPRPIPTRLMVSTPQPPIPGYYVDLLNIDTDTIHIRGSNPSRLSADVATFITGDRSASLVLPAVQTYTVTFDVDEAFKVEILRGTGATNDRAIRYLDVILPPNSRVQLTFAPEDVPPLQYDGNRDGIFEGSVPPTADVTGALADDLQGPDLTAAARQLAPDQVEITLTASDPAGVAVIEYTFDENGVVISTYTGAFIVDPAQIPTIYASADDQAGNRSRFYSWTVADLLASPTGTPTIVPPQGMERAVHG